MCSRSELSIITKEIREAYRQIYGDSLVRVVLYGSYARGDYDKESDIDIAAIVKGDRLQLQEKLKKVWDITADLELEYGTILSPTVIPSEEYDRYKDDLPYYRNIATEGVEIIA